jgi:hypothetical protein
MLEYGGTKPNLAVMSSSARREKWLVKLQHKETMSQAACSAHESRR